MNIYWLEQTEADVPHADDWLNAGELLRLGSMHFPKRRADWRLGRWTAKNAVAAYLNLSHQTRALPEVEIRPAPTGAPELFLAGQPALISISLTHREGTAACAVAEQGVCLGCDLEVVEPRSDAFLAEYFTNEEQALFTDAGQRNLFSALLWSAKESALKALRAGLRLDPRCVVVHSASIPPATAAEKSRKLIAWNRLEVRHESGRIFQGWWQQTGKLVRTVVSDSASLPPIHLLRPPNAGATQTLQQSAAIFAA